MEHFRSSVLKTQLTRVPTAVYAVHAAHDGTTLYGVEHLLSTGQALLRALPQGGRVAASWLPGVGPINPALRQ